MNIKSKNTIDVKPYIPANKSLPEITIKSILLSLIFTVIMGGANASLGLK